MNTRIQEDISSKSAVLKNQFFYYILWEDGQKRTMYHYQ